MFALIQKVHSFWAIFVLTILVIAILNSFIGRSKGYEFSVKDLRISLFALIFSHIQLLIGLVIYFVSPWYDKWDSMGIVKIMKDPKIRFYLVEHPIISIIAIALITIGWSMHLRQNLSSKKFLRIGLFYTLGLFLFLTRIPWGSWM
tara:strand:+ start:1490 stop:1927 length:438 start_codon:yes stop_codon:yes gene_type:complete